MTKISVTYHAPKGDSKMATIFGHTFYDGKIEEIEVNDATLAKLKGNSAFSIAGEKHESKSR
jgi:hypothetical protein